VTLNFKKRARSTAGSKFRSSAKNSYERSTRRWRGRILAARLMPTLVVAIGLPLVVAVQTWAITKWITPSKGLPTAARQILDDADSFNQLLVEAGVPLPAQPN
jgi:hypothetical protein